MEPVSWPIIIQSSEWLTRAIQSARSKDQQRFARLVEHVGTVVAGLRALDREAHRLFLPLIYGDVRTWPAEQRRQWADDLVRLAHEDRITPALRVSLGALNELGPQQCDQDARELVERLTTLLDWQEGQGFYWGALGMLVRANVTGMFDFLIGTELDPILRALENPDQSDLRAIRSTAAQFVYGVGGEARQYVRLESTDDPAVRRVQSRFRARPGFHRILAVNEAGELGERGWMEALETEPSMSPVTTLRPYADHAEGIFGQLLALQNRVFPSLPTPVWVWS